MLESTFKKKQRKAMEKQGWKFITLEPGGGVPMGFPDTLLLAPGGYSCFIEWKQDEHSAKQPLQQYWNERLNLMGHDAWFVNPQNWEQIRETIIRKSESVPRTTR